MSKKLKTLYVGTMNDGIFIIDRPPRPAPADYAPYGGDSETKVIATFVNNDAEAQEMARVFVTSWNRRAHPARSEETLTERDALERLEKLRQRFEEDYKGHHGGADDLMLEIFVSLGWQKFIATVCDNAEGWWWA